MLYWKAILEYLIAALNVIYLSSLLVTFWFYPAGPKRDLETDQVIGHYDGLSWKHFAMLGVFNFINSWCYNNINKANEVGIRPGIGLDIFGVNVVAMVTYSFTSKGLWVFLLIPIYAVYQVVKIVKPFCCPNKQQSDEEEEDDSVGKSKTQLKREKREKEGKPTQRVKYMK